MKKFVWLTMMVFYSSLVFTQNQQMDNLETEMSYLPEFENQFGQFDYENTLSILDNAVIFNPNSAKALVLRGNFKKLVGMDKEAELDFEAAKLLNPYSVYLYGFLGGNGLLDILSIEPQKGMDNLDFQQKLNYYYQEIDRILLVETITDLEVKMLKTGLEQLELNNIEQATEAIDRSLVTFSESAFANDLKGLLHLEKKEYQLARGYFEKALELNPKFAISWYNLGLIELRDNNYGTANKHFNQAIELQENLTKAYFERAFVKKVTGDYLGAIADYDKIIALHGEMYLEAFLNRGLTKKIIGDYSGALMDLDQIILEYPNNADLVKNRGNLNLLFNLDEVAIDDYSTAIILNPNYAEAYFNRAIAYLKVYNRTCGCQDLKKSKELGFEKAADLQLYFCNN